MNVTRRRKHGFAEAYLRLIRAKLVAGFTCLTLILRFQVFASGCSPVPSNQISWWTGEGNANDIAGVNNGSLLGGATANATGIVGSAFTFDGTNAFIRIPDSPALRPTNFTIEGWVRFASLDSAGSGGSPAGDQYIVFKQNTRSSDFEGFDLSKTRAGGNDVFRFLISSATAQSVEIHSSTILSTGVWYHVAAVKNTNQVQLYVNGALENQSSINFPIDSGAQTRGSSKLAFSPSAQPFIGREGKPAPPIRPVSQRVAFRPACRERQLTLPAAGLGHSTQVLWSCPKPHRRRCPLGLWL